MFFTMWRIFFWKNDFIWVFTERVTYARFRDKKVQKCTFQKVQPQLQLFYGFLYFFSVGQRSYVISDLVYDSKSNYRPLNLVLIEV